jgi:hypothetical protein
VLVRDPRPLNPQKDSFCNLGYARLWSRVGLPARVQPRMAVGLGLSDGEGTERLWSRLTKLITIERSSSVRQ